MGRKAVGKYIYKGDRYYEKKKSQDSGGWKGESSYSEKMGPFFTLMSCSPSPV